MRKLLKRRNIKKLNYALKIAKANKMYLQDILSIQRSFEELFHIRRSSKPKYKHKYIILEESSEGHLFGTVKFTIVSKRKNKIYGCFYK